MRALATAADAFDLAVERGVFLVQRIIRIAQVFLRWHLIGARLTVADWGFGNRLRLICRARRRSLIARFLRHRGWTADQAIQMLPVLREFGVEFLEQPLVPEDLEGTLVYLLSQDSDFVTGQMVVVNGGSQFW